VAKSKIITSALLLVLVAGTGGRSAIVSVPSEYTTIQAGINAAHSGDTVAVAAGTYSGIGNTNLQVVEKQLFIVGEQGAEFTIIDGQDSAFAGFGAQWGEIAAGTVIEGFTVTRADHGLFVSSLSDGIVVKYCHFIDNYSCGIAVEYSQPCRKCSVINCTMAGNFRGFGTYLYRPGAATSATADADYDHQFVFDGCTFDSNTIAVETFAELRNCTLRRNQTVFQLSVLPQVDVHDSEIFNNYGSVAVLTGELNDDVDRGSLFLYNCHIFNNQGGISRDTSDSRPFGRLHMSGCLYHHNTGEIDISPLPYAAVIEQNTFVDNTDFALRFSSPRRDSVVHELVDNMIVFNQGCGITYDYADPGLSIFCNDLFENDIGNYCGMLGDSTGFRSNVSVDPLFEDRPQDDYSLRTDSPCISLSSPCQETKGWPAGGNSSQMPMVDTIPPSAIGDLQ